MKVALFYYDSESSIAVANELSYKMAQVNLIQDDKNPDVVISIGGDGTLLAAMHHYVEQLDTIHFIGVHTGHLGFYTDFLNNELDELVQIVQEKKYHVISYPLLDVIVRTKSGKYEQYTALNEAVIRRVNGTLIADVMINELLFEVFRGDGVCLSTPTGSTGLNKSLGGAVLHPSVDMMQLTEIASINNRVYRTISAPMIFAREETVTIQPLESSCEGLFLSIDHLTYPADHVQTVTCQMSQKRISFIDVGKQNFWQRVESAFIGELDKGEDV